MNFLNCALVTGYLSIQNDFMCMGWSWKRRGESSHGNCTSTPMSSNPSSSMPTTRKWKSLSGILTMSAGELEGGFVAAIDTICCGRSGQQSSVAFTFDQEAEFHLAVLIPGWLEFDSVIEIEIAHAILRGQ